MAGVAQTLLTQYADEPYVWVYMRALELLGQSHGPASVPALTAALNRGEWWAPRRTSTLRSVAAAALARVGTATAVETLEHAAARGSRGVRRAAGRHLEAIRHRTRGEQR